MDIESEGHLTDKIKHADRIIIICIFGLFLLVVVLFGGIMYQNQQNALMSRKQAEQNHKRTQEYVKCVAVTLTIPIAQRSDNALDLCTDTADDRTKEAEN